MPFIGIALLIAAALGGGASVAARDALPGDALWGFKVQVNEGLSGFLVTDLQSKADWDITLAQERLDEAAKLAAAGRLDAKAQADIQENFDAHARAVADHVAALQNAGEYAAAADVAARFQAMIAKEAGGAVDLRVALDTASALSAETSVKANSQTGVDIGL